MEFIEVIKGRYSCRNYLSDPIKEEVLGDIITAGLSAPSAQNRQPWRYIVVTDKELIKKIAFHSLVGTVNYFIKDAPVVIVACADIDKSLRFNGQEYYLVDVAISFQQMMLAGWNHGIGSCWLAAFDEKALKKMLELPSNIRVVGISPFGYPKGKNLYTRTVSFFAGIKADKDKTNKVTYR
ncbi:MAG: nitroreductase family protein [Candidatus Cloacimonetes bacterium]|nr:nitroreductase family protein [Candidatus Cloacimonadota bacterium]